jgi:hypothetical protein
MAEKIEFEATGGPSDESIVEACRVAKIEGLYRQDHLTSEGTVRIGGETKSYKLTKPLPQKGSDTVDGWVRFEGVIEIEGQSAQPYLIVRHNKPGGWTESVIYVDGKNAGSVQRDWLPRDFTHEGSFQINGREHAYTIRETVARDGGVNFKKDELEALAMMAAM